MGTTGRSATKNYVTAGMLAAELRKINKGMNALTKEVSKLKKTRPITKPGNLWTKPGPYLMGDECAKGIWSGKLAIKEIGPALKALSVYQAKIARFLVANKLPK